MAEVLADIDLSIIGRVEEVIENLKFRNRASVGIRKIKREKAFTQAIDIIINSINYTLSENFKANPSIQFYGYAVLVMQDCTTISIPIVSPRQRLYYGFQPEAFRQWQHWVEFYQQYQLHRFNDINLSKLLIDSGLDYVYQRPQLKQNSWVELPIREVFIKVRKECQFELEFSQWQPIEFIDPINGIKVDGKSNQIDGDKDNGLPKDGIQPKPNPRENPFAGNPSPSSFEEIGQKGFDEIDDSKLGVPPSSGSANDLFWIELRKPRTAASFTPSCSTKYSLVIIPISIINEPYSLSFKSEGNDSCGNNSYGTYTLTSQLTGLVLGTAGFLEAFGGTIKYASGATYPQTIYYSNTEV